MQIENIEASLFQDNENISGKVVEKSISSKNFKVKEAKNIKKISQIYYSNVSSSNNSQMLPI